MSIGTRKGLVALAIVFLAAHLPFLPPTLEDIDSINFAMGVRHFDVAHHQPHPPGYPIFIALGKLSTSLLRAVGTPAPEPRGLAIWSALAGAAALILLFAFVRALDGDDRRAWWTTVVVAACPLFWFTALRPLSDMAGLCAVLAAQAPLVAAVRGATTLRSLMGAGVLAGLAIGIRSQTVLLTVPLLLLAIARLPGTVRLLPAIAVVPGILAWGVPLLVASGGPSAYLAALGSQAGEDFSGVVMLWTMRSARVAFDAALYSFVWPWGGLIVGAGVVALGCLGALRLVWRMPRAAGILLVAYAPYAIFHLVFQENATVRYALPLQIPVAWLAVWALDGLGRAPLAAGATALVLASLVLSVPATVAYGRDGSPAFRAFEAVQQSSSRPVGAVGVHAVNRRAAEWEGSALPGRVLKAPHGREWLLLVEEWKSHPDSEVSFVADPRRTDLTLFDRTAREHVVSFRWPFAEPPFVGGARPGNTDLYAMHPPGWMLDQGWALTAEVAGITARDGWGPHRKPSVAWVRTRPGDAMLMIGGRHLGGPADPPVRLHLAVDGRPLHDLEVKPGYFFTTLSLSAGALSGTAPYVPLAVTSEAADGNTRELAVGLEQFDLQPAGIPMIGAADGWYEPEYDRRTAQSWRWMSERATLWVRPVGRDVTLTLAGESPLRYFDQAPVVTVVVGSREIARFAPSSDFTQSIPLPSDALASAGGQVILQSDRAFVPNERDGTPDRRRLALKVYSFDVK